MDVTVILGVTYGLSVMVSNESPNVPFTTLCTRFLEGVERLDTSLAFY